MQMGRGSFQTGTNYQQVINSIKEKFLADMFCLLTYVVLYYRQSFTTDVWVIDFGFLLALFGVL